MRTLPRAVAKGRERKEEPRQGGGSAAGGRAKATALEEAVAGAVVALQ